MNHEINKCLNNLNEEAQKLDRLVTEADEFVAAANIIDKVHELELEIYEARKVFERTKNISNEKEKKNGH